MRKFHGPCRMSDASGRSTRQSAAARPPHFTLPISHFPLRPAFSLVEAVICTIIVATMFAAGMAAAGSAARDRIVQSEIRQGQALARLLTSEIVQQRYADPATNTIAPFPGVSTTDRSNWTHIDDYTGFSQSPPAQRAGGAISGAAGWSWRATVDYLPVNSFLGATGGTGGALGGIISSVGGVVSPVLDTTLTSATDTGLKRIIVTVTAPSGKVTSLTALRSSAGVVDRTSTGFHDFASINLLVGNDSRSVTTGAPLLNTPPSP